MVLFLLLLFMLSTGATSSTDSVVVSGFNVLTRSWTTVDAYNMNELKSYKQFSVVSTFSFSSSSSSKRITFWEPDEGYKETLLLACRDFVIQNNNNNINISIYLFEIGWSGITQEDYTCTNETDCPGIILLGTTSFAGRIKKGKDKDGSTIIPISKFISEDVFRTGKRLTDDYYSASYYNYFYEGEWYGVPFTNDYRLLYFNKTTFDTLGLAYPPPYNLTKDEWTWEKFILYCKNITNSLNVSGWTWRTMFDEETRVVMMMAQSSLTTLLNNRSMCNLNSNEFRSVISDILFELIPNLVDMGWDPSQSDFQRWYNSSSWKDAEKCDVKGPEFPSDKVTFPGMVIETPAFSNKLDLNISLPAFVPGGITFSGGTGLALTGEDDITLYWEFLKFLITGPYVKGLALKNKSLPPFRSLSQDFHINEVWDRLKDQFERSMPSQFPLLEFYDFTEMEEVKPFRCMILEIVYKHDEIKDALDRACNRINNIFLPICIPEQIEPILHPCTKGYVYVDWRPTTDACKCPVSQKKPLDCTYIPPDESWWTIATLCVTAFFALVSLLLGTYSGIHSRSKINGLNLMLFETMIIGTVIQYLSIFALICEPHQNLDCVLWVWLFGVGSSLTLSSAYITLRIRNPTNSNSCLNRLTRPSSMVHASLFMFLTLGMTCLMIFVWTFFSNGFDLYTFTKHNSWVINRTESFSISGIIGDVDVTLPICRSGDPITDNLLRIFCLIACLFFLLELVKSGQKKNYFTASIVVIFMMFMLISLLPSVTNNMYYKILCTIFFIFINASVSLFGLCVSKILVLFGIQIEDDVNVFLPKETTRSFRSAANREAGWNLDKTDQFGQTWIRNLRPHSSEWTDMESIFFCLGGRGLKIESAQAVYNKTLLRKFELNYVTFERRFEDKNLWNQDAWNDGSPVFLSRKNTIEKFETFVYCLPWKNSEICIIPVLHITGKMNAKSICSNGFSALSRVDEGWFGQGIYFTTSVHYCLSYFSNKSDPVIIIAYVQPGNIFPIIEHPHTPKSLAGCAIVPGFHSHYVLVSMNGFPNVNSHFDELVVGQDAQAIPVYILTFDEADIKSFCNQYNIPLTLPLIATPSTSTSTSTTKSSSSSSSSTMTTNKSSSSSSTKTKTTNLFADVAVTVASAPSVVWSDIEEPARSEISPLLMFESNHYV